MLPIVKADIILNFPVVLMIDMGQDYSLYEDFQHVGHVAQLKLNWGPQMIY